MVAKWTFYTGHCTKHFDKGILKVKVRYILNLDQWFSTGEGRWFCPQGHLEMSGHGWSWQGGDQRCCLAAYSAQSISNTKNDLVPNVPGAEKSWFRFQYVYKAYCTISSSPIPEVTTVPFRGGYFIYLHTSKWLACV